VPRKRSKHPTELELAILKVLWRDGSASVRQVRDALAGGAADGVAPGPGGENPRDLAVTTVTTMLNILVDKGYATRVREGRVYRYEPVISEQQTSRQMVRDLVDRLFNGSPGALMMNLIEDGEVEANELAELRARLDRLGPNAAADDDR